MFCLLWTLKPESISYKVYELIFQISWKKDFALIFCFCWSNQVTILHMSQQLSCRGMYTILPWFHISYYTKSIWFFSQILIISTLILCKWWVLTLVTCIIQPGHHCVRYGLLTFRHQAAHISPTIYFIQSLSATYFTAIVFIEKFKELYLELPSINLGPFYLGTNKFTHFMLILLWYMNKCLQFISLIKIERSKLVRINSLTRKTMTS